MRDFLSNAAARMRHVAFRRYAVSTLTVGAVLFGVFAIAGQSHASLGDAIVRSMGYVLQAIVGFVGQMLLEVVKALIWVAQYNGFVDAVPVATGWVIVRDVTNMFFILVLLLIAFGTMLGSDTYSYRNKTLSRFLIMAIVVNFSRTIAGLLIDFAQVVMLTFVNGFAAAAGGNFVDALKLGDLMQVNPKATDNGATEIVVSFFVALTFLGVSLLLIVAMLAVLVVRIVYLWLLIILSPLAFFMKAVPGGAAQGYYAEWWKMFTQQVIVGPVLAFFLWLSLVSVSAGPSALTQGFPAGATSSESVSPSVSAAFNAQTIQQFVIAFGLLAGGLMMAQRLSPQVGGKVVGAGKSLARGAAQRAARSTGIPAMLEQRKADREAKYKARGAGLRSGYNNLVGGASERFAGHVLRSPAALNRINQRKMTNIDKELAKTPAGPKRDALMNQKKNLRAEMDKGPGIAGKTIGRFGNLLAGKAAKDKAIARRAGLGAIEPQMKDAKTKSDADLISSIDDQSLSSADRQAASMVAAERSLLNDEKLAAAARKNMMGADEGMKNTFDGNMRAKNQLGAENSVQLLDAGKLKMSDLSVDAAGSNAVKIASSKSAHKYIADADMDQTVAMHKTLAGLPEDQKTNATRKAQLSTQSEGGLKAAFGVTSDGKFAKPELQQALAGVIESPGGGSALVKIEPKELMTKDKKLTDAGRTVTSALAENPSAANSLVKEADRVPSKKSNAAMEEVLSSAIMASREEQKKAPDARNEKLASLESKLRQNRSVRDKLPPAEGGVTPVAQAPSAETKGGKSDTAPEKPAVVGVTSAGGGARSVEINVDVGDIEADIGKSLDEASMDDIKAQLNKYEQMAGKSGKAGEAAAKKAEKTLEVLKRMEKDSKPKPTSRQA